MNGELARTYQVPYPRAMEVCTQLLTDLGMQIKAQRSEGDQAVIETERRDGTPMTLKVKVIGLGRDGGIRAHRRGRLLEQGSFHAVSGAHR